MRARPAGPRPGQSLVLCPQGTAELDGQGIVPWSVIQWGRDPVPSGRAAPFFSDARGDV